MSTLPKNVDSQSARTKILRAALRLIRTKGYGATTVEELCAEAGVTKGAFFYHFATKEQMAIAAAQFFSDRADLLFMHADYQQLADPLARLLGYVDMRRAILRGDLPDFTCLLGTMVQETYITHPAIREACETHIWRNAKMVEQDIEAAMQKYGVHHCTAASLAVYVQGVIQGAFILAKASESVQVVEDSLNHLRRYIQMLFARNPSGGAQPGVQQT